VLSQSGYRMVY